MMNEDNQMKKRVFPDEEERQIEQILSKKEFIEAEILPDIDSIDDMLGKQSLPQKKRIWGKVILALLILLLLATIAQSVQWLIIAWQTAQWISFSFAVICLSFILLLVGGLLTEWMKLVKLSIHCHNQQNSEQLWQDERTASGQIGVQFCQSIATQMQKNRPNSPLVKQWQAQLDEVYSSKEVLTLFSETVLLPIDNQVKTLIQKSAVENAILVGISPLATLDILIVIWRNFALISQIGRLYGIELGYLSRLKLWKMVLNQAILAGTSEFIGNLSVEYLSHNLTAKLSIRMAQGVSIGLLTARLGIKAMEFSRPLSFQEKEKRALSYLNQQVFASLKQTIWKKLVKSES